MKGGIAFFVAVLAVLSAQYPAAASAVGGLVAVLGFLAGYTTRSGAWTFALAMAVVGAIFWVATTRMSPAEGLAAVAVASAYAVGVFARLEIAGRPVGGPERG